MAEEILIAELRAATAKFDRDLKQAASMADKASREIAKGLGGIEKAVKDLPSEFKRFNDELKKTEREATRTATASGGLIKGLRSLKRAAAVVGLIILAKEAAELTANMLRAGDAITATRRGLENALGSADAATAAFSFLRSESNRLALNTLSTADSFTKMANSARGTVLEGDALKLVFSGMNEASIGLKLSQDQLNRVFIQLNQAISLQKFELEDIKTIAEAGVPVFKLLQSALGQTGPELRKSISEGKIGLNELILLADEANKQFSALAEDAAQTVPNRFRRMFSDISIEAALAGEEILSSLGVERLVDSIELLFDTLSSTITRDDVVSFFNEVAKAASGAVNFVNDLIKGTGSLLKFLRDRAAAVSRALEAFNKAAGLTGDDRSTINEAIQRNNELIKLEEEYLDELLYLNEGKNKELLDQELETERKKQKVVDDAHARRAQLQAQLSDAELKRVERDRLRLLEKQKQLEERAARELRDVVRENAARIAREAAQAEEMALQAVISGKSVLGPLLDSEAGKAAKKAAEEQAKEFEKIFERAADNIQDTFADLFSDTLQGDLPRIQDFADSVQSIFANMAAAIVTDQLIKPLLEEAVKSATGAFKKDGAVGRLLGENVSGKLGGITGGLALGVGVGSTASRVLGPSREASTASGALGGAVSGATIGAQFGSYYGAAIGAVVGAIAGGAGGFFSAKGEKRTNANLQTVSPGANFPVTVQDEGRVRTPFGDVGIAGFHLESGDFLSAVAEFDRQLSRLLPDVLKKRVEETFRQVENQAVGKSEGAALSKIIQQRGFDAIKAILGEDVAENVAGPRGYVSSTGIQTVQARVAEALGIVRQIEEFKTGDLTDVGEALKVIRDRFTDLQLSAEAFGISTVEIVAERDRLLAKVTADVNADIDQLYLELTDPVAAQFAELEKQQKEQLKRAQEAGANVAKLEEVQVLQRKQLAEELADANGDVNDSLSETARLIEGLRPQMEAFVREGLSPARQQLLALEERFRQLSTEAKALGLDTLALSESYRTQSREIFRQATSSISLAIAQIANPFQAALKQVAEQVRQFQMLADDGLIPQRVVDQFEQLATNQARYQQALSLASGVTLTPAAQLNELARNFINQGLISDTQRELDALAHQFVQIQRALIFVGLPTDELTKAYQRQREAILAATDAVEDSVDTAADIVQKAIDIINGAQSPIEQVASAFDEFIRAGNPLSGANQALYDLTETFLNLKDAASLLGLSSADLERSYLDQAAAIREQLIADIDASLEPRRQVIEQAGEFLNRLRVGDELPNNLRFAEAQSQFRNVATSGDLQAAIAAGEQLRTIARESFGSTSDFFSVRNDIISTIEGLQQQEQAAIEAERARLIREETRQLEQLSVARSSLDSLQRIQSSNNDVARSNELILRELRATREDNQRIESLLRQVVA